MLRRKGLVLCLLFILSILVSCRAMTESTEELQEAVYSKYQAEFTEVFDTYSIIVGYAVTQEEFGRYAQIIKDSMVRQQQYFDIYKDYPGINNLKTINDNAGLAPVKVDKEIIDLLIFCKEAYVNTNQVINAAMGSVLSIWHTYREDADFDPFSAALPGMEELRTAAQNTDIENLIIDEEESTVFLMNKGMSLDVGAIAKGYAAKKAIEEAKQAGAVSLLASIGGNIISVGKPLDGFRERWGVGVQDPNLSADGVTNILDTIFLNDMAVVTSGDYQRYYVVDGKMYNHIIDPKTLMPAEYFQAVTILHEDSAIADMLSTAAFILPYEEGKKLLESYGAEALWVLPDDTDLATEGYKRISKNYSDYSAVD